MAWLFLLIAGLLEVGWAIGLKYTEGFSRLWPSVWTIAAMIFSLAFLGLALKALPVGTAYAVWTGIGAIGTVILGIYLFDEPATAARLACIGLILSGIVGLKLLPWWSQEPLRIDIPFKLERPARFRRMREPAAQIAGQVERARRFHQN